MRDRRREVRDPVFTCAKIGFPDGRFPLRCEVCNISASGAKLLLPTGTADFPVEFRLRIAGEDNEYMAETRWLKGVSVGVELKRPIDASVLDLWRSQSTRWWLAA